LVVIHNCQTLRASALLNDKVKLHCLFTVNWLVSLYVSSTPAPLEIIFTIFVILFVSASGKNELFTLFYHATLHEGEGSEWLTS
jgi:hypothetical protein